MKSRLTHCFDRLRVRQGTALIPFITAGDPHPSMTVSLMHALVTAGADIIELGIPFSDPMADGPIIQRASERALAAGVSLREVITMVKAFRNQNATTPVVLMGYLNPIEAIGYSNFVKIAQEAGVDGVLTVDLPPEEMNEFGMLLNLHELTPIFLVAPTTSSERIQRICAQAEGYLYYVSLKGVTGSSDLNVDQIAEKVKAIRQYTTLPIGVGFGIKDAATAAKVASISDAIIIGSALVKLVEITAQEHLLTQVTQFLQDMRMAIDNVEKIA
jgi:tryptophan synthase alpha chain